MIYKYGELKDKGLDNYNISKKVENKELYKIEKGLYSDTEKYNHYERKICAYCDQRVAPDGVVSIKERLEDAIY